VGGGLAWIGEHKAYLFLMTAVAAGAVALSAALNLWGLVELEKLAYAAPAAFVAGLVDTGGGGGGGVWGGGGGGGGEGGGGGGGAPARRGPPPVHAGLG